MITNPVLRGFNPDPSAIVVDKVAYIATSSFLWMPAVRIYQSTDLVNYEYCTDVLTKIDLSGLNHDCGIWAPQLSYVNQTFYLVYTIVSSNARPFKDTKNFLVTAPSIKGPWSKPIYLNSSGFDPSFFHHENKSYLLNTIWDYRKTTSNKSAGIIIQEYDHTTNKLVGPVIDLFKGTTAAKTEASHLYYFKPYFYLITAEGGTGSDHQVTSARSKNLFGPYELDPSNPILTAKDNPELLLQCSGHGSIISFNDKLYMYHLAVRNHLGKPSLLGRETAIQPIKITDGWLRLDSTDNKPLTRLNYHLTAKKSVKRFYQNFSNKLKKNWNTLYKYDIKKWSEKASEGLFVYGGYSIQALSDIHLLGIRQTSFDFKASVKFDYQAAHYNQFFGFNLYLNELNYLQFIITNQNNQMTGQLHYKINNQSYFDQAVIVINQEINHEVTFTLQDNILSIVCDNVCYPTKLDVSYLNGGFTGNFICLSVHDLNTYLGSKALLKEFELIEL